MIKIAAGTPIRMRGAALLAASLLPMSSFAAKDFTRIVPAEAVIAGWSNDVPALRKAADESPYGRLLADPALEPLRKAISDLYIRKDADTGEADPFMVELMQNLPGGAGFYMRQEGEVFNPDALSINAIAEVDEQSRPWLQKQMDELTTHFSDLKKDSFEAAGVTVFRLSGSLADQELHHNSAEGAPKVIQYAFLDEYFVLSDSFDESAIREAIGILHNDGATKTIAGREELTIYTSRRPLGDGQFHLFVDTHKLIASGIESATTMQPAFRDFLPTSGLYDIQALFATTTFAAGSTQVNVGIVTPETKNGLVRTLHDMGPTPLELVSLASSDSLGVTSFSLDVGSVFDESMLLVDKASPQAGAYLRMFIYAWQGQVGGNLLDGVVKNIQGEHLLIQRDFEPEIKERLTPQELATQKSMAAFLSIKNPEQTTANLKGILENMKAMPGQGELLELGEVDGLTTAIFRPPTSPASSPLLLALAIAPNRLIVANTETQLREAIRAHQGQVASPMAGEAGFRDVLDNLDRTNLYAFSYSPQSSVADGVEQLHRFFELGLMPNMPQFDPAMIPDAEVAARYIGDSYSATYFDNRLVFMDIQVKHARQQ